MSTIKEQMLVLREEKKHSVRYDAKMAEAGETPVLTGVYVSKAHLTQPWPKLFKCTLEEVTK